jgi:hypothetical protein
MNKAIYEKFYFPLSDTPDDVGSGSAAAELSVDDLDNLLAEDDTKEEPLELAKSEKEEIEEVEEKEEEDKLELKDDEEDKVDLVVPVSKKKILAKYPNLFKEFPYLETAYYADQAYKELLPTLDDAKEVIEKAKVLDSFEQNLIQGDTERLLANIKQADGKAFTKIVDNYLPTLAKVDKGAFDHIITNITKQTIMAMAGEARTSGNEELAKAALLLNQFAFGTSQFSQPTKLNNDNPEQENQVQRERAEFTRERFTVVKEDLDTRINNTLKSTIDQHIDPKQSMTDYVKKNAVREALEATDRIIANDQVFRKQLDAAWKRAFESNFNRDSIGRIRSMYLSKAKTVLPQIIAKTRNEAMRGLGKRTNEPVKRGIVSPGRPSTSISGKSEDKNKIPKGMKTIDFLMQD